MFKRVIITTLILILAVFNLGAVEAPIQTNIDSGYKAFQEKDYQKAIDSFLKVYKRLDNDAIKMDTASYLGLSYRMLGDYNKSTNYFKEALDYAYKIKDIPSSAKIKGHIAENEKLLKNYDQSIAFYNEALSIVGVKNDDVAALFYGLAESYFLQGDYDNAVSTCKLGGDITSESPIELLQLGCEILSGESYQKAENVPEALKYFRSAYDKSFARGYHNLAIKSLISMGDIYSELNRVNAARAKYEDALSIMLDENIINDSFYELIKMLSEPFFTNHNNLTLGGKLEKYIVKNSKNESYDNLSTMMILTGEYFTLSKEYKKALQIFVKAYQEAKINKDNYGAVRSLTGLAYANFMTGRSAIANLRIDEAIYRAKTIKGYSSADELIFIKALILAKNFRMIEAEKLLTEAIDISTDESNKIRYNDELKKVQRIARADRILYGDKLDNLTALERDDENVEFSINELLTLDNPDVITDDDAVLNSDNISDDTDSSQEAIEENIGDNATDNHTLKNEKPLDKSNGKISDNLSDKKPAPAKK